MLALGVSWQGMRLQDTMSTCYLLTRSLHYSFC